MIPDHPNPWAKNPDPALVPLVKKAGLAPEFTIQQASRTGSYLKGSHCILHLSIHFHQAENLRIPDPLLHFNEPGPSVPCPVLMSLHDKAKTFQPATGKHSSVRTTMFE